MGAVGGSILIDISTREQYMEFDNMYDKSAIAEMLYADVKLD